MNQKIKLHIQGMHCAACEILVERQFKKIAGVQRVQADHVTGEAAVACQGNPALAEFARALQPHGYTVSVWNETGGAPVRNTKRDYAEIGGMFLLIAALYLILRQYDILPNLGVSEQMGYGVVFLIGIVAALSTCMAVTGGLLLAIAAKYNERSPEANGWQKFRPHLYFNLGRVVAYTLLGAAVGALGSILTPSPQATGVLTIMASIVMVLLGLQLLKLFPALTRIGPRMPKFLGHRIHDLSTTNHPAGPILLGAATFFLPCGFTQALQLYVLSQGDATRGALTMLTFALGTLPALLSIGVISSFARGTFQRYFLKFAGALVIVLGLFNINNGLALTGNAIDFKAYFHSPGEPAVTTDPNVTLVNGVQVVRMQVNGYDYTPAQFTVQAGIPVEWQIDGSRAAGCAQVITMPALGITEYLPRQSIKTIRFTPQQAGTLRFSCTMGMTTPGAAFIVVSNPQANAAAPARQVVTQNFSPAACDPTVMDCVPAQRLQMEISRERGFYPNSFTVKAGVPVELEIDTKVPMGGCMSTMLVPAYNVAHRLTLGKSTLRFTPTQAGVVPFTCSMGSRLGQFVVTN